MKKIVSGLDEKIAEGKRSVFGVVKQEESETKKEEIKTKSSKK